MITKTVYAFSYISSMRFYVFYLVSMCRIYKLDETTGDGCGFPYVCLDLGGHSSDHLIWKNLSICVLRRRRSISPLMYPRFLNIKSYFIRSSFGLSQWCWKVLNLISVHLPHEVFLSKRRTRLVLGVETLMWKEAMVAFALVAVSLPWSDRCMVVLNAWCVVVVVVIEV